MALYQFGGVRGWTRGIRMGCVVLLSALIAVLMSAVPAVAEEQVLEAQADNIASGTYDGVDWRITSSGELVLGNGDVQEFVYREERDAEDYPWLEHAEDIVSCQFDGTVKGNGSMGYMFYNCACIRSIDFIGWDTSQVTDINRMFWYCTSLASLDVSGWDTSNITSMNTTFVHCAWLTSLDLSGWDTSNVTDMEGMFVRCGRLASLDLSGWDTSSVTNMKELFMCCTSLSSLDITGWDFVQVTDMESMFYGCDSLSSLDLSSWDTSNVTDMHSMFYDCDSLSSLDLSSWDTSNVTDMHSMFYDCESLTSLDVSGWDTSSVTDMSGLFLDCPALASLDVSSWDTSSVTDMSGTFSGCESLTSLDVSGWDTSNVTDMSCLFLDCPALASLDVSSWDTSCVSFLGSAFDGCSSLAAIDVSSWDTSNVIDMSALFLACSALSSLDLSGWDTSSLTYLDSTFKDCYSLTTIDVSGWDTSSVTNMSRTFSGCGSLASLDVSGWDTSNVTDMSGTFSGCRSLASLDLSNWDTSGVTETDDMFSNTNLAFLKVGVRYAVNYDAMFPDAVSADGWWSVADGRLYTKDQIVSDRSGIADTYLSEVPAIDSGTCDGVSWKLTATGNLVLGDGGEQEFAHREAREAGDYPWLSYMADITSVSIDGTVKGNGSMGHMLDGCTSLKKLDFSSFDTSQVSGADGMFAGCTSLQRFIVGSEYAIQTVDMFPEALSDEGWWSVADGRFYTKDEIVSGRSGVADTYLPVPSFFADANPYDETNHGDDVTWMGFTGISEGWMRADGTREFRGMQNVKRCDFAAFLYRMADMEDDGERNDSLALSAEEVDTVLEGVSDCDADTYHAADIAWMISTGISRGWADRYSDTVSFRPMANVARQDMAAFLYRYADIKDDGEMNTSLELGSEEVTFSDVIHGDDTNHATEVEWLASVGVTKGWNMGDGTYQFRGRRNVARQDMAAFMHRLYTHLNA